jgi:hypothetical protein
MLLNNLYNKRCYYPISIHEKFGVLDLFFLTGNSRFNRAPFPMPSFEASFAELKFHSFSFLGISIIGPSEPSLRTSKYGALPVKGKMTSTT